MSVIIVNWNGDHLLKDCLDSLRSQTFKDFEIILVDNGSADKSPDHVSEYYPEIKIIRLPKNMGFSRANNIGILAANGKYIALLNNDARAHHMWLDYLVEVADHHPKAGMLASKVLRPSEEIDSLGCTLYPDGIGICRGRGKSGNSAWSCCMEAVDFPSGCAALYRRSALNEVGLFDPKFFMYCEDVDLGIRLKAKGWECWYVPGAVVTHLYSQSSSAYSFKKLFYVERNRIRVMWKHFTWKQIVKSIPYTIRRYFLFAIRGHAWAS